MMRFAPIFAVLFVAACQDKAPTAAVHTSEGGITFTLIALPDNADVSIQMAWASDWAYRADTNKAAPFVGADLILAGGADGYAAGDVGERFADIESEGYLYLSGNDHLIGELTFPAEHLDETITIANAHLRAPAFDPVWFDRITDGLADTIAEAGTQPANASFDAARWAVFGDVPLRAALSLDDAAIFASLTVADIAAWHDETIDNTPDVVVVTGGIDAATAGAALDDLLAGLPMRAPVAAPAVAVNYGGQPILLHMPNAAVTTLALIGPLPPTRLGDEMEDLILLHALGGDDQSVLSTTVRDDLRASYAFGAGFDNFTREHRLLYMFGEVGPDQLAAVETSVRRAYADFITAGAPDQIDARKAVFAPGFADLTDFISDLARSELQSQLDGYAAGRALSLSAELDAVTAASLAQRLAQAYAPLTGLVTVAVSPDAAALPDACVITAPAQAVRCR